MKNRSLTYCTNVHPLQNYGALTSSIPYFSGKIGDLLAWRPLPMGLWLNETVLGAIYPKGIGDLRKSLEKWGATTFTLNAFPQGDFHEAEVKKKVYLPDWTDSGRLIYTQRCAEVLAGLLADRDFGSISTLPLGWREDWTQDRSLRAADALVEMARFLNGMKHRTGKTIALALEPEPGCVLERIPQVTGFWDEILRPAAARAGQSEAVDRHLGICYDTCHQAVQFEDPEEALGMLLDAGIAVHKMQLSSALEFPADPAAIPPSKGGLRAQFVEPRFLHQTRVKTPQGIMAFDDLPEALAEPGLFQYPWRVHFHLPIHADSLLDSSAVRTTRGDMLTALRFALKNGMCSHFEVETYTWNVLPEAHRPVTDEALAQCLAQELSFIRDQVPGVFDHA